MIMSRGEILQLLEEGDIRRNALYWHPTFHLDRRSLGFYSRNKVTGAFEYWSPPSGPYCPSMNLTMYSGVLTQEVGVYRAPAMWIGNVACDNCAQAANERFWSLKVSEDCTLLNRRDRHSANPSKHFPSSKTWGAVVSDLGDVLIEPSELTKDRFVGEYERLRPAHFVPGQTKWDSMLRRHGRWLDRLYQYSWYYDGRLRALAVMLQTDLSASLESIVSSRDTPTKGPLKFGWGNILLTSLILSLSRSGVVFFDAGVTEPYGSYKAKTYLDSYQVPAISVTARRVRALYWRSRGVI